MHRARVVVAEGTDVELLDPSARVVHQGEPMEQSGPELIDLVGV
jgi:hypothetical protein